MAVYIGRYDGDIPATASGTVSCYLINNGPTTCSWAFQGTKTVKMLYITITATSRCDLPWWKANNLWCSIDAHFEDGAGSASVSLCSMKVAYPLFVAICSLSPLSVPRIHDQQLVTLCWRVFSGWGRERISGSFDHHDGRYIKKRQLCTKVYILWFTVTYLSATRNRKTRNPEPESGTDGSSPNPAKCAGWQVRVLFWPAKRQRERFLNWSGTEPTRFCGPDLDRLQVTCTHC